MNEGRFGAEPAPRGWRVALAVLATFSVAIAMEFLPWPAWAQALRIVPSFPDLALVYWVIRRPRAVGYAAALLLGLFMDMATQSPMGFTALAYAVMTLLASVARTRFALIGPVQQSLHVLFVLCCGQLLLLMLQQFDGALPAQFWAQLSFRYFSPSAAGAALWLLLPMLIRRATGRWSRDEH